MIASGLACCSSLCGTAAAQDNQKPNILLIVCEDISPYLRCYGDSVAVSPNLDSFAQGAIRHTNMYTCVGVSAPSRYSLITGRYSSNDGANFMRVDDFVSDYEAVPPAGVKCYTEYLREAGYYCTNNDKTDYQFNPPIAAWDEQGKDAHWRNAPQNQPFFSIFNIFVTHESQVWRRTDMPLSVDPDEIIVPLYYPDTQIVRHDMAVMYSNVTEMDRQFQVLLDELESSGRADNAIVIFYSDNGGPLPRGKREIMDSGSRVPFMIRLLDNKDAGSVNSELNMFVDIPATVLSLAGVEIPENLHGVAMYGSQRAVQPREYVFGATNRFDEQVEKRASIRNDRYQYIYNYMPEQSIYRPVEYRLDMPMMAEMVEMYRNGELSAVQSRWFDVAGCSEELYDCIEDPLQVNNLASDKSYESVLEQMRRAFQREWIEPYNSEWVEWNEDEFIAQRQPEGVKQSVEPILTKVEDNVVTVLNDPKINSISFQICRDGEPLSTQYKLYSEPISLQSGESLVLLMERIGYISATKKIENLK